MITATIQSLCITLPDRFIPGQELTQIEASALEKLLLTRLRYFATSWLDKGLIRDQVQTNLVEFLKTYEFTAKPPSENPDPVQIEAMRLARELLLKKLNKEGIDLDQEALSRHAAQVAKLPQVRERAEKIVSLRHRAVLSTLKVKQDGHYLNQKAVRLTTNKR